MPTLNKGVTVWGHKKFNDTPARPSRQRGYLNRLVEPPKKKPASKRPVSFIHRVDVIARQLRGL